MQYLLVIAFLFSSIVHSGQRPIELAMDKLFGEHDVYVEFFHSFQSAVSSGDKAKVAASISYPITVYSKNTKKEYRSEKEILKDYSSIFTENVINAVSDQQLEDAFVNYNGVMFGGGQVWYSGICKDKNCKEVSVKVISINTDAPK